MIARHARTALFAAIAALVVLAGCQMPADQNQPAFGLADALVTFPDSMQPAPGSRAPLASEAEVITRVQGLFTPVRDNYNALAIDGITFVADLLNSLDIDLFGNEDLMAYLEENGSVVLGGTTSDGNEARYEIVKNVNDYTVAGWTNYGGTWAQAIYIDFTAAGDDISGDVWVAEDTNAAGRAIFQATLNNNDPDYGLVTEFRADNLDSQSTSLVNVPTKLWLKAYDDGTTFQIAANVYYVDIDVESGEIEPYYMSVLNNGQVSAFTVNDPGVNGAYSYRGAFDISGSTDRGKIDLALVPANYTGTDFFTAYSVGANYETAIASWILDPADPALMNAINGYPGIPNGGHTSTTAPTAQQIADLFADLEHIYEQDPSDADLANVLFATQLTNPAYFDGSLAESFVGTEDLLKPAWADTLPAFALAIEVDQTALGSMTVEFPTAMAATPPATTF